VAIVMGGVSPVDMQVMITKSVEVAKQYGQEIHKSAVTQQNKAEDEARLQEENTKKVHDRNSAERIYSTEEDDGNSKGNRSHDGNNKKDKDNESQEEQTETKDEKKRYEGVQGHFDIKI
jgi:hypothetical protein